jgi:hypothetical protein
MSHAVAGKQTAGALHFYCSIGLFVFVLVGQALPPAMVGEEQKPQAKPPAPQRRQHKSIHPDFSLDVRLLSY